ncbi:MAG: P13 family porin [Treponema sp.]|jgi:hypothetical protein|nr:P13 family porin [Treponema sp.]
MKNILFAVLLAFICNTAFSQEHDNPFPEMVAPEGLNSAIQPDGVYSEAQALLAEGLNRNFNAISSLAGFLTEEDRIALYQEFVFPNWKRIVGIPLSFAVGYGIGSFIQGDTVWGGISLAVDIVGSTSLYTGMFLFSASIAAMPFLAVAGKFSETWTLANWLLFGGLGLVAGNHIASGIRSITYPKIYDNQLRRALKLENAVMDIEPAIVSSSSGPGLALVQFRF